MKPCIPSKKCGSILVVVMVIMVTLSLMVVALLQLGSFNEIGTVRQLRITQAHWMAEAGLERALSRVMGSSSFLPGTNGTISTTFANSEMLLDRLGSYEVTVVKTNITTVRAGYGITSIGKAGNNAMVATNTVKLTFEAGPGGQQALIALGTNTTSKIAANQTINGTIYTEGPLSIANGVHSDDLNGIIDAGKITGNSAVAMQGELPDPGPPTIDSTQRTYFSNLLYRAKSTSTNDAVQGDTKSSVLVYTDNKAYVNGSVEIDSDIPPGITIVAAGGIKNESSHTIFDLGVNLVARDSVEFKNQVTLKERTLVYTEKDIIFDTSGNAGEPSTADGTTLLALGNITTKNIGFNGIIYAEGSVKITSGSDIAGTVIAGTYFEIASNVTVTYDPNVFVTPNPINYGGSHYIIIGTWQWAESPF